MEDSIFQDGDSTFALLKEEKTEYDILNDFHFLFQHENFLKVEEMEKRVLSPLELTLSKIKLSTLIKM